MATIKFGAIVTDMRGKLGGHVFQKGNQSRVMKTGTLPKGRKTSIVQVRNNQLAQLRSDWNDLTVTNKQAWQLAAPNYTFKSKFGDQQAYNGYQFFLFLNMNLAKIGVASLTTPNGIDPTVGRSQINTATFVAATQTFGSSGTLGSPINKFIFYVQRKGTAAQKVDAKKFIATQADPAFAAGNFARYQAFRAVIGFIAAGDIVYVGVQDVNDYGFVNSIQWVLASTT